MSGEYEGLEDGDQRQHEETLRQLYEEEMRFKATEEYFEWLEHYSKAHEIPETQS